MRIIKTPECTKTSLYSDHAQSQIKFSIEDDKDTEELQLSYDHMFENTLQHIKLPQLVHCPIKQVNVLVSTWYGSFLKGISQCIVITRTLLCRLYC